MERTKPPVPKAHIGDRISILVDADRGAYEIDTVVAVHLLVSKSKGWRIAYQCKKNDDYHFEGEHFGELVESGGRQWNGLPEPKYWIDALVKYKYGFRDWSAGVIDEITMEYRTLRWEIEYWFKNIEEPVKEGWIGTVIEQRFEPPRSIDEFNEQTNDRESEGAL